VVTRIGRATEYTVIALGAFLDIEGAFNRTSFDIIKQDAERHGTESAICRWICATLQSGNIIATLSRQTLGASIHSQRVSAGRCAFASAVELDHALSLEAQQ
jgi:hypothetical protein